MFVFFLTLSYLTFVHSFPNSLSTIVSFGNSYTDTGNVYRLTNHQWPPPTDYHGRFCNGPIWIDYVVQCLRPHRFLNFAYGSATLDNRVIQGYTGENESVEVPGVAQQIKQLKSDHPKPLPNTLYTTWGGTNDYYFSLVTKGTPYPASEVVPNIMSNLVTEVQYGAKNLLVIGSAPLSHLPYSIENNLVKIFSKIEKDHDLLLTSSIKKFKKQFPKVEVLLYKPNLLFRKIFNNPSKFGFKNTTGACFTGTIGREVCDNVDQYVFWDTFHMTSKIHYLMAEEIQELIRERMNRKRF